ncbi:MAG: hypothetical protein MJ247_04995 [Alphaproteobacteria bacterium]|nr:hypothetical protein [Alphaproteobacteria bacterium]
MEEKTKLKTDNKTKENEIIELKDEDLSTVSAGSFDHVINPPGHIDNSND